MQQKSPRKVNLQKIFTKKTDNLKLKINNLLMISIQSISNKYLMLTLIKKIMFWSLVYHKILNLIFEINSLI